MRRIAIALLAAVLILAPAGASTTPAQAQDNTAVAINTKDGTDIFKLAFKIARVNQDVVDQSNAAAAFNSCSDCQSIAVAFQIILIFSDPAVVDSQNLALAINVDCDACVAFASAYQWLLTTDGPVRFTAEGNQRLAALKKRLRDLLQSDLTIEQLRAELDEIRDEVANILATELVPAGPSRETPSSTTDGSTTTTPQGPTTTPEPTSTPEQTTTNEQPTTTEGSTTTTP
jgi:putative peptide zinc metalloprotease protein